jgi:hypothetical protein
LAISRTDTKPPARELKVGKTYEVKTFAGVVVHMKVTGYYEKRKDANRNFYKGVLTRPDDIKALKSAGVPYRGDENPEDCEGTVFSFQVTKEVRIRKNQKSKSGKRRIVRPKK